MAAPTWTFSALRANLFCDVHESHVGWHGEVTQYFQREVDKDHGRVRPKDHIVVHLEASVVVALEVSAGDGKGSNGGLVDVRKLGARRHLVVDAINWGCADRQCEPKEGSLHAGCERKRVFLVVSRPSSPIGGRLGANNACLWCTAVGEWVSSVGEGCVCQVWDVGEESLQQDHQPTERRKLFTS